MAKDDYQVIVYQIRDWIFNR